MFKSLAALAAFFMLAACQTTEQAKPTIEAPKVADHRIGKVIPGRTFCDRASIDLVVEGDKASNAAAEFAIKKLLDERKCLGTNRHIPVIVKTIEYKYVDYNGEEVLVIGVVPAFAPNEHLKYMLWLDRSKTNTKHWRKPGIEYRQA